DPLVTYGKAAATLAERTPYLAEAETMARSGVEAARKNVAGLRHYYKTEESYRTVVDSTTASARDVLGWGLFKEGRLAEAERELTAARDADATNVDVLYHIGRLEEANGDLDAAERSYSDGLAVDTAGVNPNEKALEALYAKRHGGLAGYDGYTAE